MVIGECVGEWGPVNGIRLWCSICLGHPQAFDWGPRCWGDDGSSLIRVWVVRLESGG